MTIQPIDQDQLRQRVRASTPFAHFHIDNFLDPDFAELVHDSFPTMQRAQQVGRGFAGVNEKGKVQITDESQFAEPFKQLNRELASPQWRDLLSYVMDIPNLQADPQLVGGGIHMTGPRGHLDVHVDFNYLQDRQLHRRANILVFFNKNWQPQWGGATELWDQQVKECHHSLLPVFNRCVVFATSDISFHGVTAVTCPPDVARKSFAAYYYTAEAPSWWHGAFSDTQFRARPTERFKRRVLMPAERTVKTLRRWTRR